MSLVYLIVVGAVAGYVATRMMRLNMNPATTILIGVAGALVGGVLFQGMLAVLGLLGGIIGAVIGAVVVIYIYQAVKRPK